MRIKLIFILLATAVGAVFLIRTWHLRSYGQSTSDPASARAVSQTTELRMYDVGRIVERFGIPADAQILRSSREYEVRYDAVKELISPLAINNESSANRAMVEWQGRLFANLNPEGHLSVERGLRKLDQMEKATPQLRPIIGPIPSLTPVGETGLTLIYDVADFTTRFIMPNDSISAAAGHSGNGLFGSGPPQFASSSALQTVQSQGLFGSGSTSSTASLTGQECIDLLIRFIQEIVLPDSWRDNGGQDGSIRETGGLLIITQSPENHLKVQTLLKNLRLLRASIDRGDSIRPVGMNLSMAIPPADKAEEDPEHIAKLDVEVKELVLENATLQEAVILLQEKTHANIIMDAKTLAEAGYPLDKKIRLRLYDLNVRKILEVLEKAYDENNLPLGLGVRDGVIRIAPLLAISETERTPLLVYDVHDLVDRFLTPNDVQAAELRPVGVGGPFSPGQPEAPSTTQRVNPGSPEKVTNFTRQENIDMLIWLIQEYVDANSWRDNGGSLGAIRELGGLLIVNQLPENQKQVERVLRNLRKMRAAIDRGDPDRGKGIDLLKK